MSSLIVTRFAPSPTGWLHLGHAFAAWYAREMARQAGGRFLLRFEDIDETRVRDNYYNAIEEDLRWLGLCWEGEPLRQLNRLALYQNALENLHELDLLYPCFCTRKELATTAPQQGDPSTIYPGTCRGIPTAEAIERLAAEPHAWRIDMAKAAKRVGTLDFLDRNYGRIIVEPHQLGDVVIARKELATSYHLAVVVDDALQEVSLVTRGEDLLDSTHVHRVLQKLLGYEAPEYAHHALVLDGEGKRLAKRSDSLSLRALRQAGVSAEDVLELCQSSLHER